MVFNSLSFLVFFAVVYATYLALPHRWRNWLLLLASYVFYGWWDWRFAGLLLLTSFSSWTSGLLIAHCRERGRGRTAWWACFANVAVNLVILGFFKYWNFCAESFMAIFDCIGVGVDVHLVSVVLPVGISFYTFQAMSYPIDVYRGELEATRDWVDFFAFVAFFPQLVAGPIERAGHLLPQFKVVHEFDYDRVADGLILATWGMFKKVVIADRLAVYVDAVYGNLSGYCGIAVALATFFFAFQILCDFSGYSDIAIGVARILGFDLMTNFRSPYFARSLADFWRRWHISLSTWFRDYFYISLGGNRVGNFRHFLNLFLTFLVSGIWHGAAWTFVIWGALHGGLMVAEAATRTIGKSLWRRIGGERIGMLRGVLRTGSTFLAVYVAWIFFRASSLPNALLAIRRVVEAPGEVIQIVRLLWAGLSPWTGRFHILPTVFPVRDVCLGFGLIAILSCVDFLQCRQWGLARLRALPRIVRWTIYYFLLMGILLLGMFGESEFIYFQF